MWSEENERKKKEIFANFGSIPSLWWETWRSNVRVAERSFADRRRNRRTNRYRWQCVSMSWSRRKKKSFTRNLLNKHKRKSGEAKGFSRRAKKLTVSIYVYTNTWSTEKEVGLRGEVKKLFERKDLASSEWTKINTRNYKHFCSKWLFVALCFVWTRGDTFALIASRKNKPTEERNNHNLSWNCWKP